MKKIIICSIIIVTLLSLSGCTMYDGAAYLKNELDIMKCTESQPPKAQADFKTAKSDCINSIVDEEYFKAGVSSATIDWIKEVHRRTYQDCMGKKGYSCMWEVHYK